MRRPIILGAVGLVWAMSAAAGAETVKLEFWHPYGPPWDAIMNRYAESFNKNFPNIQVIPRSVPDLHAKLPVAVAGGAAPDVAHIWGIANMIAFSDGVLEPIDGYLRQLPQWNPNDVFPAFLEAVRFEGRIWALPQAAQPTSLVWSKQAFADVGLEGQLGPQSQLELEQAIRKLTRFKGDGTLERVGFLPDMWGGFFNWTYHWGGKLYDEATRKITAASDATNVEALQWIVDLYDQYGGVAAVSAWRRQFQRTNDPLYLGKQGMAFFSHYMYYQAHLDAPEWEYGFSVIPPLGPASAQPKGPVTHTDVMAVIKGTKHPREATLFVWWSTVADGYLEGLLKTSGHPSASISVNRKAHFQNLVPEWYPQQLWLQNFDVLQKARAWPAIPVLNDLSAELGKAQSAAINKQKSARAALTEVERVIQAKLDEKLAKK